MNRKPFQKLEGSRKSVFEAHEQSMLDPLPLEHFVIAQWKKARVNVDYHIEVEGHCYSVPYPHAGQTVDVRFMPTPLEVFLDGGRIASHARPLTSPSRTRGRFTTLTEHMPKAHQKQLEWSPERLIGWALKTGEATASLMQKVLESRTHVEQGYRSCLGILRLGKTYGPERLEAACRRALALQAYSFGSVESILKKKLEAEPLPGALKADPSAAMRVTHRNVRGKDYYLSTSEDSAHEPGLEADTTLN